MKALVEQLTAALESASEALSVLDPLARDHNDVIIDDALRAAREAADLVEAQVDQVALATVFAGVYAADRSIGVANHAATMNATAAVSEFAKVIRGVQQT